MKPDLAQTQKWLWKLITAPEGVVAKKAALPIRDGLKLTAARRVEIYANMYFYRLRDSLAQDFQAVKAVLGVRDFHKLVADYLAAHPPTHFSLRYAGEKMPAFLKRDRSRRVFPYLHDLAHFEWELLEAFDAPEIPVTTLGELRKIEPHQWLALEFRLDPSVRFVDFGFPIHKIREAALGGKVFKKNSRQKTTIQFWRKNYEVLYKTLTPREAKARRLFERPQTFEALCVKLGRLFRNETSAVKALSQLVADLVSEGLCSVRPMV